jgi:hypothetical protein
MINIVERQFDRQYKCNVCGRPIKHKGNCLSCNLRAKRGKDNQVSPLVDQILGIKSFNHEEIQTQTKNILESLGYLVELEKKVQAKRPGRIDLFAKKDNFSIGIEIDHSLIRLKSIDKLNNLKPSLAIFILKSRNINIDGLESRENLIRIKSLLVYLVERKIKNLRGSKSKQGTKLYKGKKKLI